jgi:cytochrome P450
VTTSQAGPVPSIPVSDHWNVASHRRQSDTVWWDDEIKAWAVIGYAEAVAVLESLVSSPTLYDTLQRDVAKATDIFLMDDERHRRCRGAMASALARGRVAHILDGVLLPQAHAVAALLAPTFSLVDDFASPYYRAAIFTVVGVNDADGCLLETAVKEAHHYFDAEGPRSERGRAAQQILHELARDICAGTPGHSGAGDTLIAYLRARQGELILDEDEIIGLILSFIETLALKAATDLTATLCRHLSRMPPETQRHLAGDMPLLYAAAGEAARLQQHGSIPRTAGQDMTLGGHTIRRGDRVVVLIGEADRDPARFADPDRFDPFRAGKGRRHLGFGAGPRRCVGEKLGRSIAAAGAAALLDVGTLRAADPAGDRITFAI